MKKIFAVLLVGMFLFGSINCFAQSGETHSQIIYTEVVDNTGATATTTAIPVTKIRPDVDKIVGITVIQIAGSTTSGATAALFDATSTAIVTTTELICEYEATLYHDSGAMFVFPRYIVNGIVVTQSAQSKVIIYYIRQ